MKCIIQRVSEASIEIDKIFGGKIGKGLVVLVAFAETDTADTVGWCVDKIANLRIFEDDCGKMNNSTLDIGGEVLLVSNFTILGDTKKGRRPSFDRAASPEISIPLYNLTVEKFKEVFPTLVTGRFGADMRVNLINDGPVTLIVEK